MWRLAALLAGLLMVAGCAQAGRGERLATADSPGTVGNIRVGVDGGRAEARKVVLVAFRFSSEGIEAQEVRVAHGSTSRPHADRHDFRLALVDAQQRRLEEYDIWDPRRVAVEKQGLVQMTEMRYIARWPFHADAWEAWVLDRNGKPLASVLVRPTIESFCAEQRQDTDCQSFP